MLNRFKKNLIAIMIGMVLCLPVFASESTVSYVNINNLAYEDLEIVLTDDGKILVPFKQLANIFNIKYNANRVDKMIGFVTLDGKQGVINQNGVYINDEQISKRAPIFLTQGIMEGVFNEAYITDDVASKLLGAKIEANFETLTINATVDRNIPILASVNNQLVAEDNSPKAYPDVVAPKKPWKITLNTIGLNSYLLSDNMSSTQYGREDINDTISGSTQLSASGRIFGGKYRVEATEMHSRMYPFFFGGLTASYGNKFTTKNGKTHYYELGRVKGRADEDAQIGTNIFGAQYWNYDYDRENPQDLHGYVKPTSTVRLIANDQEPVILSTYAGYYTLKDVQLPNPVTYIKLEEVNEDGTSELIREERYNVYGNDRPFEKENRYSAYAGVWGYQNRFFRDGRDVYRGENKKVTAGGYYQRGLKDNITFESKLTADKIYEKVNSSIVYTVPTNDSLLVSGTQKSVNYLEGATSLNSVDWQSEKHKCLKARATAGVSVAHDIREDYTKAGLGAKLAGEYNQDLNKFEYGILKPRYARARLEGFYTSPDYYIASSDTTSKNDRVGGLVKAGFGFNSTSVNGHYSQYYSNINQKYAGGTLKFNEASVNANTKIPKVASLRFNSFLRRGANDTGRNLNYYYDANATRDFGHYATLQLGRRENYYDTKFNEETSLNHNYHSKYADNYIQVDVPIPGNNHGKAQLGHSFVRYNSGNYDNGYNVFKFGYVFPTWKRVTFGAGLGWRYYGQTGLDWYASMNYRTSSGQTMSIGYQYSKLNGYFIDNMFTPTTNRHSVNFVFNDAFQVFHRGLKSIGVEDLDKGIFEAVAFIDVDKDGKYTKKVDIPVQNIPLLTTWSGEKYLTNKKGRVYSSSVAQGVYKVSLNMDELPLTVSPVNNDLINKTIRIDGGQTTKVEIPLTSTVGSVSGTLKITDDFDRNLKITDFVVVLLDEQGNEVNYSTLSDTGEFYISGLAPGKYKLQLDERFIGAYGLEEVSGLSSREIFIPYDYTTPYDAVDQNLEYKTLAL